MASSARASSSLIERPFLAGGMLLVVALALAKLALHWIFNNRYGYFRDEFDYMACGNHLAWGFVDQPPLVPLAAKLTRVFFGDSLRSIRFPAALASSAAVVVTGMLARELGGRRFALLLAALAVLIAPIYLSDGSLLTTNAFEPLLWAGCAWCAALAVHRDPRYWLAFGVVAGIGLEEKYSILVLGFGIAVGLLLTGQRRVLANRWFWLGGAAAFLIFLPNLIWNLQNHFPFLELTRNIKADGRDVQLSAFQYFAQQILLIHPFTFPVWITGLIALLFTRRWKPYRFLGISYLVAFAAFVVQHGKNYYLTPIYPMLLAAGAVAIESGIERTRQVWWKPAIVSALLIGGVLLAPITMPVLSVDQFLSYMNALPFAVPRTEKSHAAAALPQHYADQFGWPEMVAAVAQAWDRIPAAERAGCGVFAQDYGQAGAIDFFGPRYGLPPALSGHQSYWLWGPRGYSGNCLIILDDRPARMHELFEDVEYMGSSDNPYALERHVPVYICRGKKFSSLAEAWPKLKKWR